MDQRQLERFVDVVESGSLSRTSRRMNISQPALSKSLRLMEEQLGTKLLERGPRGVRVTRLGDVFYRRARAITAEFRRARQDLDELKGSMAGHVALGATPGPGLLDQIVPKAIQRTAAKRPTLRFTVRSGSAQELLPALHRGELDILFTVLDGEVKGPDLKVQRLFEDQFVLVVGSRHRLLRKREITLADLTAHHWVFLQDASPLWTAVGDLARQRQMVPCGQMESNSVVFIRAMVSTSDAIGVLPRYAAEIGVENGMLGIIPLARVVENSVLPRLRRPIGVVHSTMTDLTPASEALLRAIETVCRDRNLLKGYE